MKYSTGGPRYVVGEGTVTYISKTASKLFSLFYFSYLILRFTENQTTEVMFNLYW